MTKSDPALPNVTVDLSTVFEAKGLMATPYAIDTSKIHGRTVSQLFDAILPMQGMTYMDKTMLIALLSAVEGDQETIRKQSWKIRDGEVREAKLRLENEHLTRIAYFDALTLIQNRLGFLKELEGEISRFADVGNQGRRRDDGSAVIFIDLRKFKPINDEFGHEAGDEALKLVANEVKKLIRSDDVVGRWGGDEFVVLLRNIRAPESQAVLKRLEDRLESFVLDYKGTQIGFSARMGLTNIELNQTSTEVMHAADMVMINSKTPEERGGPAMVIGGKPQPR